MDQEQIIAKIEKKFATVNARIDLLENQLDRLQKRVRELETMVEDDQDFDPSEYNLSEEEMKSITESAENDAKIVFDSIEENRSLSQNPPSSHVSLVIDLNKNDKK
ncbi:MAG: hypothetical protein WC773_02465 [Patescibacteria group bacterium]|jgi:uncharacterized coiled-coil protein SlyX